MMDPRLAWLIGILTMLAVFIFVYSRTNSLRMGFIVSLVWGKIVTGIFWALGIDVPLFTVYYYSNGVFHRLLTVSANMIIFLTLLATTAFLILYPRYGRELTRALAR